MSSKGYWVFHRTWWKREKDRHGMTRLVPGPGRKTTIAKGVTIDEALGICKRWNATHKPGPLSRKAEFTEL